MTITPFSVCAFFSFGILAARIASAQPIDNAGDASNINPLAHIGRDAIAAFSAKPLFVPSRLAPHEIESTTAPIEEPAEVTEPPKVQVVGIIKTPREYIAQIIDLSDQSRYSVREGDFVGTWLVASIDGDSVKLRGVDLEQDFRIETTSAQPFTAEPASDPQASTPNPTTEPSHVSEADRIGFFGKGTRAPN